MNSSSVWQPFTRRNELELVRQVQGVGQADATRYIALTV